MSTTHSDEYDAVIDALHVQYTPKMQAVLGEVRAIFVDQIGWWAGDTYDMDDEEYVWTFQAAPTEFGKGDDPAIDVSITLGEAVVFGDGESNPFGVSFRLDIVGYGGRIIGGIAPYNYTEDCWVDGTDADAVAARWQLIQDANLTEIPALTSVAEEIVSISLHVLPCRGNPG